MKFLLSVRFEVEPVLVDEFESLGGRFEEVGGSQSSKKRPVGVPLVSLRSGCRPVSGEVASGVPLGVGGDNGSLGSQPDLFVDFLEVTAEEP